MQSRSPVPAKRGRPSRGARVCLQHRGPCAVPPQARRPAWHRPIHCPSCAPQAPVDPRRGVPGKSAPWPQGAGRPGPGGHQGSPRPQAPGPGAPTPAPLSVRGLSPGETPSRLPRRCWAAPRACGGVEFLLAKAGDRQKYSRQNISGAEFMKAFEFGLGTFFPLPLSPPPGPEWGAGGGDRVQMWRGGWPPPPAPLAAGCGNQWPLCVRRPAAPRALPCERRGSAPAWSLPPNLGVRGNCLQRRPGPGGP